MQPMRLPSTFSETAPAAGAEGRHVPSAGRPWGHVGKGIAAFVAGIMIGASTIIIAELVTPQPDAPPPFEQGPVELRR
jgi:hypothetical protein